MSATIDTTTVTPGRPPLIASARWRIVALVMVGVAVMSTARIISDNSDLTSSGTFGVALRTAAPLALAGLSGLIAERSGTINIGLDGMMVMGTIFAGWWGWEYGPWMALLGGIIGGMLGGLVMSVATTTFGVNHIVAGVAINLIAPGVARFMASELFVGVQGGSVTSSNRQPAGRRYSTFSCRRCWARTVNPASSRSPAWATINKSLLSTSNSAFGLHQSIANSKSEAGA